jgi:hypothetical protein
VLSREDVKRLVARDHNLDKYFTSKWKEVPKRLFEISVEPRGAVNLLKKKSVLY